MLLMLDANHGSRLGAVDASVSSLIKWLTLHVKHKRIDRKSKREMEWNSTTGT
jgi:hypothetical protein